MSRASITAASGSGLDLTTAPVAAPVLAAVNPTPEFVAMPGPGQVCPYSGLKRGMLYQLTKEGLIRTVSLRRKGTTRARRLIVFSSLMDYLRGLDAEQNAPRQ
ncbi:MAG: hypothetical protein WCF18_22730 [Chthoniobacteraceae bacterium]